jgi:broad specificity phosphatase PhoE
MDNFREIQVGEVELWKDRAAGWAFHDCVFAEWIRGNPNAAFPGGDSFHMLWARVREGLELIVETHDGRNVIVVGHGGSFIATIRKLVPDLEILRGGSSNCSVTELMVERADSRLQAHMLAWSTCSHLLGEAAQFVSGTPDRPVQPGLPQS